MTNSLHLARALARMPLVAILRGVTASEAGEVGAELVAAGIEVLEVPVNSPGPYDSIRILRDTLGDSAVVGAGTVVSSRDVEQVSNAGGQIAVAPNTDETVIEACLRHGVVPVPGFTTVTEAFRAVHAGARFLKLFPVDAFAPSYLGGCAVGRVEAGRIVWSRGNERLAQTVPDVEPGSDRRGAHVRLDWPPSGPWSRGLPLIKPPAAPAAA